MKIEINKVDKTNEVLMFFITLIYISTMVFIALTKQYEASEMRNNLSFIGNKSSMLLTAIVFFRQSKGLLKIFIFALLSFCIVNVGNEFLNIFKIVNTDAALCMFIESVLILLSVILYRIYAISK